MKEVTTLAKGAKAYGKATYNIKESDMDICKVVNEARAKGKYRDKEVYSLPDVAIIGCKEAEHHEEHRNYDRDFGPSGPVAVGPMMSGPMMSGSAMSSPMYGSEPMLGGAPSTAVKPSEPVCKSKLSKLSKHKNKHTKHTEKHKAEKHC